MMEAEVKCRNCGVCNDTAYSQCISCRKLQEEFTLNLPGECNNCATISRCDCRNTPFTSNPPPSSERMILLDTQKYSETNFDNRSFKSGKSDRPPCDVAPTDFVADRVIEREIDTNKMRNLDNVKPSVPRLSTDRLPTCRHNMGVSVISILKSGEVCYEWMGKKSSRNKERVYDVCRISSDGLKVSLSSALNSSKNM